MVLLQVPGAHAGLALATALASYVNAGLLYRHLRRDGVYRPHPGWPRFLLQVLLAVTAMAVLVAWGMPGAEVMSSMDASVRVGSLALWIAAGVAAYLVALRMTGMRLSMLWAPAGESGRAP
jgi:putative peptidoglycan lipid II flippase